jgi:hypothetical protein
MPWVSKSAESSYLGTVERAMQGGNVFNAFKSIPSWYAVVGYGCATSAMHSAKKTYNTPEVQANLAEFAKNDSLGSPPTLKLTYGTFGYDTLRFSESVSYLFKQFSDLSGKRIVEFGSNYGGLARCILIQWPSVKAYHCLDLEPVQTFQRKYMSNLPFEHPAIVFDEPTEQGDLFISEYCLTEFTDDDLYALYERYCKNAEGGLIRCNLADKKRERVFLDTMRQDFSIEVTPEPEVRSPNKIVVFRR